MPSRSPLAAPAAVVLLAAVLFPLPLAQGAGYATANPADSPRLLGGEVLLFQFDADDFNTRFPGSILDHSGNDHDLLWTDGGTRGDGPYGGSLLKHPGKIRLTSCCAGPDRIRGELTVAAWIKPLDCASRQILYQQIGVSGGSFQLEADCPAGVVTVEIQSLCCGKYHKRFPWTLPLAEWSHVALVLSTGAFSYYVNGELQGVLSRGEVTNVGPVACGGCAVVGADTSVGYSSGDASWFRGAMDEFRLYDRALSPAEVADVMSRPYWRPNSAPVAAIAPIPTGECVDGEADLVLDGTPSSDVDGDALAYAWTTAGTVASPSSALTDATFPLGATPVTLAVSDDQYTVEATATAKVADSVFPVTTATLAGTRGTGEWWRSDVDVTLTASDACGVASTRHRLDGGAWIEGTTLSVAGDGDHALAFTSTDLGGNLEGERSALVRIDATPPAAAILEPRPGHTYVNDVHVAGLTGLPTVLLLENTVRVDATDATSGVARVEFWIDGALRHTDATFRYSFVWDTALERAGAHRLEIRAVDHAGNVAATAMEVLTLPADPEAVRASLPATGR